jgi:hypothetical protein
MSEAERLRAVLQALVDSGSGNGSRITVSKAAFDAAVDAVTRPSR